MKNSKLYLVLVGLIPTVQILFDTINAFKLDNEIRTILGGSLILLFLILNGVKQYLDPKLRNSTVMWISIVLFVGYLAGGIVDHLQVFSFSENVDAIIRIVMTAVAAISSSIVKQLDAIEDSSNKRSYPNNLTPKIGGEEPPKRPK